MPTSIAHIPGRVQRWLSSSYMLTLLCALGLSVPLNAQESPAENVHALSPSIVLVLKLISKTEVKPTTGIVISDSGLVLVPAPLVTEPGEIVVLDNGVDIAVNGRPAVIVDMPHSGGLALISVPGLERPGIILSENALEAGQSLHLETFPPPKLMAKGAEPLWVPVEIAPQDAIMRTAISPETPLPYITGPIIDSCGYFAGLSVAIGPSSMELDQLPVVAFTDELIQVFDAMQVTLPSARCQSAVSTQIESASIDEQALADKSSSPDLEIADEPTIPEPTIEETGQAQQEPEKVVTAGNEFRADEKPSIWRDVPLWLILLGISILAGLVWKAAFWFRQIRQPQQQQTPRQADSHTGGLAADEPDTSQLGLEPTSVDSKPRSAPLDNNTRPDMNALPEGCNAVVVSEGFFDKESAFRRYCAVNYENMDIIIGRGDVDISIEHPAISREHARLSSYHGSLTLSDLDSSNGSFIGETPCLSGEIMFIENNDPISLGQLKITIKIARTQADLT